MRSAAEIAAEVGRGSSLRGSVEAGAGTTAAGGVAACCCCSPCARAAERGASAAAMAATTLAVAWESRFMSNGCTGFRDVPLGGAGGLRRGGRDFPYTPQRSERLEKRRCQSSVTVPSCQSHSGFRTENYWELTTSTDDWQRRSQLRPGQSKHERRPAARLALDGHVAAHRAGELAADGQAEAGAFDRLGEGAVRLHEGLEDRLQLLRRDAASAVGHAHRDRAALRRLAGHADRAAGVRELHGVREQVEDDLPHLVLVGEGAD